MNRRLVACLAGGLFLLLMLGSCSTCFMVPSDVTAEQMHVINTQIDTLHEQIAATRSPGTWAMLVFAASLLIPIVLAVLLLHEADRGAIGRDEIFRHAVHHRLTPDMVHAALELEQQKKSGSITKLLPQVNHQVKRWREDRPALPGKGSDQPEEDDPLC